MIIFWGMGRIIQVSIHHVVHLTEITANGNYLSKMVKH